ncbi:MAG: tetratricopeptide repeat protein [Candidatus Chisholmbacteria bacterium]|nr:tetratricopeptide repeat protein [Candidatus Chisholmbacteria bacterium]
MRRLIVILAALGVIAYVPTLWGGFIWDDEQFIQKNVFLTSWEYVDEIFKTNTIAGAGMVSNYYRPVTTLSFLVDRQIWGLVPFWFHWHNMLIHVGAGVMLFFLLRALGLGERAAFWVAAIFLVHPIQTEAVAHADTRGDALYALWLFAGLYLWTLSFRAFSHVGALRLPGSSPFGSAQGKHSARRAQPLDFARDRRGDTIALKSLATVSGVRMSKGWLMILSIFAYVMSFLSKEVGLAGAGLYGLVLVHQGIRGTRSTRGTKGIKSMEGIATPMAALSRKLEIKGIKSIMGTLLSFRAQLIGLLGIAIVAGGYIWLRLTVLNFANSLNFHGVQSIYTESLWVRLMTFGKVFWIYLGLLVWPHPLHMERTSDLFTSFNPWVAGVMGLFILMAVLGWVEFKKRGSLWIWLGSVWYGVMLVPISGIVPINGLLYEHWLYGPLTGFLLVIYGLFSFLRNYVTRTRMRYLTYGLVVLMSVYMVLTWRMNWIWGEPKRFYEYTLRYAETARLHNNLGMAYADEGRVGEAIWQYRRALELAPEFYPHIYHNLGNAYGVLGDVAEAEQFYRQAIELNPDFHLSYAQLINIYIGQEKYAEALSYAETLTRAYPGNIQFQLVYGQLLWKLERLEEAEAIFEKVLVMTNYAPEVERVVEGIKKVQEVQ